MTEKANAILTNAVAPDQASPSSTTGPAGPVPFATPSRRLARIHSIEDFRESARRALPRMVFDFIDGGAGSESTVRENRAAFERVRLVPSGPVDVAARTPRIGLFGCQQALPVVIGPIGLASAFWPDGEIALARAAARHGIPFVLSNGTSIPTGDVMRAVQGRKWFQLYVPPDERLLDKWLDQIDSEGYDVLEVTVDTAVPGRRLRDVRNGFSMPLRWTPGKVLDVALHPRWMMDMLRHGAPKPVMWEEAAASRPAATVSERNLSAISPRLDWHTIERLRARWPHALVIKGLADPRQASRAHAAGVDGLVVSNHGGRQLDGAIAALDILPEIVDALGARIPVLVDSGIRSGSDILKALALGASAVQIGRAAVYALATAGEAGVDRALSLLREELDQAMALCGVRTCAEVTREHVRVAPWSPAEGRA
ncbi:alpha-hydroxy acid oxidase [Paraburkholderia fungorum]|uniref:alpha-hydroxy acid oxidase n=1 Tax=Paraburkholderia fungorum TaxID=134537 RepID=UPI0038BBCF0B